MLVENLSTKVVRKSWPLPAISKVQKRHLILQRL